MINSIASSGTCVLRNLFYVPQAAAQGTPSCILLSARTVCHLNAISPVAAPSEAPVVQGASVLFKGCTASTALHKCCSQHCGTGTVQQLRPYSNGQPTASTSSQHQQAASQPLQQQHNTLFSIRPSSLSPLYSTYQNDRQRDERRQLLLSLLKAHEILAANAEGLDQVQITRGIRYRVSQMRELSDDLRRLVTDKDAATNLPVCQDAALMYGFYNLLDERASKSDVDGAAFRDVQLGKTDVWQHWYENFASKYRNTPGLEPLHVIFSKPDPMETLRRLRPKADIQIRPAPDTVVKGCYLDKEAVAHAEGKRHTAVAKVEVVPGMGRIMINGAPYDAVIKEVHMRQMLLAPLMASNTLHQFNVNVKVEGGGPSGQAQAIATGIARAIAMYMPSLETKLQKWIVWDGRVKERKKWGQKGARRKFTWVKR